MNALEICTHYWSSPLPKQVSSHEPVCLIGATIQQVRKRAEKKTHLQLDCPVRVAWNHLKADFLAGSRKEELEKATC